TPARPAPRRWAARSWENPPPAASSASAGHPADRVSACAPPCPGSSPRPPPPTRAPAPPASRQTIACSSCSRSPPTPALSIPRRTFSLPPSRAPAPSRPSPPSPRPPGQSVVSPRGNHSLSCSCLGSSSSRVSGSFFQLQSTLPLEEPTTLCHQTCFEGPRFVPHGYQKTADLQK